MNTYKTWIAYYTVSRKEIVRTLRIWRQSFVPSAMTMALYLIIFGSLLGSRIQDIEVFSYIQFIVPGIIMMSVIMNSFSNTVGGFYMAKFSKSVEEMLVSPMPTWVMIAGYCTGGIFRGLVVGALVVLVSLFFAAIHIYNLLVIITFILLTAIVFSLAGFLNSLFANSFDDIMFVPNFVLIPLTYLGGVFYSISILPTFWQYISMANPILYMVNGFRYGFLGFSDVPVWISFALLLITAIILLAINIILVKKGFGLKE
jgi:ABC-2 type transport system permease protein